MIYRVDNITKSFGGHTALSNLSIEINEPGIYGILGPNGAGKSTFIKLMLKILTPDSGMIYYHGTNIEDIGNRYFKDIGAVLEGNRNLYWFMSARENMRYYGRLMGLSDDAIKCRTEELVSIMDLRGHEDKKVGYCSRGMQQKVAIMAALIHSPKILFLDEPTLGLDITTKLSVISEIQRMAENGTTVFLTTHQIDVLERLTNRLIILEKGIFTYNGSIDSLVSSQRAQQCTNYILEFSDEAPRVLSGIISPESIRVNDEKSQLQITISNSNKLFQNNFIRICMENNLRILAITPEVPTLEETLIRFWRSHHE